jgi:hypothetical protein
MTRTDRDLIALSQEVDRFTREARRAWFPTEESRFKIWRPGAVAFGPIGEIREAIYELFRWKEALRRMTAPGTVYSNRHLQQARTKINGLEDLIQEGLQKLRTEFRLSGGQRSELDSFERQMKQGGSQVVESWGKMLGRLDWLIDRLERSYGRRPEDGDRSSRTPDG